VNEDRRRDVAVALGAIAALTLAVWLAFHPARAFQRMGFIALASAIGVLAVIAVARARARGELATLRPRGGDLTLAALVAAAFYALALGGRPVLFPRGDPREMAFLLAYVPLLDPLSDGRHAVALGAGLICALEELVLRSMVQPALTRSWGAVRGWLATAALDALAWLPTAFLLGDPRIGLNWVLVGFAGSVAVVTGWLRIRTDRVVPAALARALLAWALIEFPIWSPG
jgi:membrane protease YdiL (CAAX protease family)